MNKKELKKNFYVNQNFFDFNIVSSSKVNIIPINDIGKEVVYEFGWVGTLKPNYDNESFDLFIGKDVTKQKLTELRDRMDMMISERVVYGKNANNTNN